MGTTSFSSSHSTNRLDSLHERVLELERIIDKLADLKGETREDLPHSYPNGDTFYDMS